MQKRRFSVVMSRWELFGGLCYFFFYLLLLNPLLQLFLTNVLHQEVTTLRLNIWFYGACALLTALFFGRFLLGNLRPLRQDLRRSLLKTFLCLLLYGATSILVSALILWILPDYSNYNNNAVLGIMGENPAFLILMSVILAPVIEECLFRGLVFGNLRRCSRVLAYAVTALGFSAIHVVGYLGVLSPLEVALSALQYLPATLVLCGLYEQTDTIWSPILLHAVINLINFLFWSLLF